MGGWGDFCLMGGNFCVRCIPTTGSYKRASNAVCDRCEGKTAKWKPCKKWRDNLLIKRVSESLPFVCLHRHMSHPSLGISLVFFCFLFFFVLCAFQPLFPAGTQSSKDGSPFRLRRRVIDNNPVRKTKTKTSKNAGNWRWGLIGDGIW